MKFRKKASDLYNEHEPIFGSKVSFEVAFPEIDEITVEVSETGGFGTRDNIAQYTKESLSEYIDCSNDICHGGGFSIGDILRKMIANKQTEFETFKTCRGNEASAGGKRIYRNCVNRFDVKIEITYKTAE